MATKSWASTLRAIRNPLGFFALGLLVIEGVIGTIAAFRLQDQYALYALGIMALLFVLVVGLVAAITFWHPTHLYEQVDELKKTINSEGFRDVLEDAIIDLVKDECLQQQETAGDGHQSVQ